MNLRAFLIKSAKIKVQSVNVGWAWNINGALRQAEEVFVVVKVVKDIMDGWTGGCMNSAKVDNLGQNMILVLLKIFRQETTAATTWQQTVPVAIYCDVVCQLFVSAHQGRKAIAACVATMKGWKKRFLHSHTVSTLRFIADEMETLFSTLTLCWF